MTAAHAAPGDSAEPADRATDPEVRGSALSADTDAALVHAARRGEGDAFGRLVRRHLRAAHGVALSVLRNPHDADDAVQDAFLTALRRLDELSDPTKFRAWLLAIVRNGARNLRSYEAVRDTAPLEAAYQASSSDDPARDTAVSELRSRLGAALDGLTSLQREVLLLYDYEGWSHGEIGERMGISAGASRYNLFVARRKMRRLLAGNERSGDDDGTTA